MIKNAITRLSVTRIPFPRNPAFLHVEENPLAIGLIGILGIHEKAKTAIRIIHDSGAQTRPSARMKLLFPSSNALLNPRRGWHYVATGASPWFKALIS
jgi:hypothetical protein